MLEAELPLSGGGTPTASEHQLPWICSGGEVGRIYSVTDRRWQDLVGTHGLTEKIALRLGAPERDHGGELGRPEGNAAARLLNHAQGRTHSTDLRLV